MTEAFETVASAAFARVKEERGGTINVDVLTGQEAKDVSAPSYLPTPPISSPFSRLPEC